jgi:hypothetical protein
MYVDVYIDVCQYKFEDAETRAAETRVGILRSAQDDREEKQKRKR